MRLVIVVITQSITFDIHQNKFYACVLNLSLAYHWAGRPTHAVTLISNFRTSAPKKLNDIDLSSNGLTNAFEGAKGKFLFANIGNKEHHQTFLCISQFQVLPSLPRPTPSNFFHQMPGGQSSQGPLILINCTLLRHFQDLNPYLSIEYLQIHIENTDLSMKTM